MGQCIYLFSSNARLRYFEDCLHALMLPREMTMHFRYRVEHLDPDFVAAIGKHTVVGSAVVVSYLYQEYSEGKWAPKTIRPLRLGRLLEANVDGPTVHIYFAVTGYPVLSTNDLQSAANRALRKHERFSYASIGDALNDGDTSTEDSDAKTFISIVEAFKEEELRGSFTGGGEIEQIDPLFVRIEGLYKKGGLLTPTRVGLTDRERGYKIDSDDPLELRIRYHQPKWSKVDQREYALLLDVDRECFAVPVREQIQVASPYDTAEFTLLPLRGKRDWLSRIGINSRSADGVIGEVVRFAALVLGAARTPTWVTASIDALTPLVAILLAGTSTYIALESKAQPSSAVNVPPGLWAAWIVSGLVVAANAVIKFRNR